MDGRDWKRWTSHLRANTHEVKHKDYFTFLTTDIIPGDIVFSDKQHHFPELNLILFHESVATHLWYRNPQRPGSRIGFQTSKTTSMNLFSISYLVFYPDI